MLSVMDSASLLLARPALLAMLYSLSVSACSSAAESGLPSSGPETQDGWEWRASYSSPACANGSTCGELIDDRDGTHYRTVTVGAQTWLAESLNFGVRRALADPPA